MHAQVVRAQIQPGRLDDWLATVRDSIVPVARQQKGYRGSYVLIDRETSKILTVSLWETEAELAAIASSGFYQEQVAKVARFLAVPPEREVYEVAIQG